MLPPHQTSGLDCHARNGPPPSPHGPSSDDGHRPYAQAANRAAKRLVQLEELAAKQELAARAAQAAAGGGEGPTYQTRTYQHGQMEMDKDVRVEDAEQEAARLEANAAGIDNLFDEAMRIKDKKKGSK